MGDGDSRPADGGTGHGPRDWLAGAARLLPGTALGNARRAMEDITRQVADRRALTEGLDTPDPGPGDFSGLDRQECLDLLASRSLGRLAYHERQDVIAVVPVTYVLADGEVVVRTGPGPKLQAADRGDGMSLQVDDIDERSATGWSVLVVGRVRRLAQGEARRLGRLPEPWATGPRHHVIAIRPARITGRRLR